MSNFKRTADWLAACGKTPSADNLSIQIGCDMEEAVEFWKTIEFSMPPGAMLKAMQALQIIDAVATDIKKGNIKARIAVELRADALDALCDREVTGNGIAYLAGFDKPPADNAVMDANDNKLVDGKPVILEGGKIGKPEGWTPADLSPFIGTPTDTTIQ